MSATTDTSETRTSETGASPPGISAPEDLRECAHCGLICAVPALRPAFGADCPRCGQGLPAPRGRGFRLALACALAGVAFFVFATIAPFLEISSYGHFRLARLETGPEELAAQGWFLIGIVVLLVTVVMPATRLAIVIATLLGLNREWVPRGLLRETFRWYEPLRPWAMVDVYLLGFLVAYSRLVALAQVRLDTALFAVVGLMLCIAATDTFLDAEAVWRGIDQGKAANRVCRTGTATGARQIGCQSCGLVNQALPGDICRRCAIVLEDRKPGSITRSWAYVIAALILYIPSNLFPVMTISNLVHTQQYTIMGGVFELFESGLWPLAALVFVASIMIPITKLLALMYMLVTTQLGSPEYLIGRTRAFRVVDFIGRWSMIDVFMLSILVALVRFGIFDQVQAEFGATCFAGVVILTMFAAAAFDPRLMWDRAGQPAATARLAAGKA